MDIRKKVTLIWLPAILFACVSCLETKEEANPDPAVKSSSTQSNANATFNTLKVSGNVDDLGNDIKARGLVWNTTGDPTIVDAKTTEANNIFTATIDKLIPNTTYFFKVYATTADGVFYSNEIELKTRTLAGTTWDIYFDHGIHESGYNMAWHGDVTFKADGTTIYDEPDYPGKYYFEGTWSLNGNMLTYDMDASDPNPRNYVLTAILENETLKGTYTFGTADKPFTAVLR
jgi:hypothetical protein